MLRSKPISTALKAGTKLNSAEIRSLSTMPYFSLRIFITFSEQLLALGIFQGQAAHQHVQILTGEGFRPGACSPGPGQMGQQVGDGKLGLPFLSPTRTVISWPSLRMILPWRARGMAVTGTS